MVVSKLTMGSPVSVLNCKAYAGAAAARASSSHEKHLVIAVIDGPFIICSSFPVKPWQQ
jgi:hypothetical protein